MSPIAARSKGKSQSSQAAAEGWHILEDNLLRKVFAASNQTAKRIGRLLLDLRKGVQTEHLLASNVLAGLTAVTKLSLKFEQSQLQPALATLHRVSANMSLEIVSRPAPGRATADPLQSGLCIYVPLIASCSNLAALSLNDAASPAVTEEGFRFTQLSSLTQLTSLMYRERKAPISAVHDTHRGVCPEQTSLHLEDAAVTTGILSHVLDSVSNMEKLTFLHLDGLMGSWDLPVLSFLPHLETLDKIAINNDDTMSSASGRLRALCFSSKLKTLAVDFTGTNKTCVALFTSQLFAHALQLQSASFSSEKVTSRQPLCDSSRLGQNYKID
ncbi:hypothetical protein WJX77_008478 [Trebouxia sp. C0004]